VRPFELLAAEEGVGRRERARVELAEDAVNVDDLAVVHLEFEPGALEFRLQHRNVEAGDVVTAEVAAVDVVVELLGDQRKHRAVFDVLVGDAVHGDGTGRNRHFRVQPPHGVLGVAVGEYLQHGDFDDPVPLRHDSGTLDIEYGQRPLELQFVGHDSLLLIAWGFREEYTTVSGAMQSECLIFRPPSRSGIDKPFRVCYFLLYRGVAP